MFPQAGHYHQYKNLNGVWWESYVRATITESGAWDEYFQDDWGGHSDFADGAVVWHTYRDNGHFDSWSPNPEGRGRGKDRGESLGRYMLQAGIWKSTKKIKKITWTTS